MIEQKKWSLWITQKISQNIRKRVRTKKEFFLDEYIQYIYLNQKDYDFYNNALFLFEDLLIEQKANKEKAMIYMDTLNTFCYDLNYNLVYIIKRFK